MGLRSAIRRLGFALTYRATDLAYWIGIPTPKRTAAGSYWSYELANPHGDDPGLAALDRLPRDAVILDAGSHVGEYAVPLARDTDRSVVALEPSPVNVARLLRTIARNDLIDQIDVHRVGLLDTNGTAPFYGSSFSKMSSFDPDAVGGRIRFIESTPIRALDSFVANYNLHPDGIKIDVEGVEQQVLDGATQTIERERPLVVLEVHDSAIAPDIAGWFEEREYRVERYDLTFVCTPVSG